MPLLMFLLTLFGRLLGAWLTWDVNNKFPFSMTDVFICLKLSLVGDPIGLVLWFFYYRNT